MQHRACCSLPGRCDGGGGGEAGREAQACSRIDCSPVPWLTGERRARAYAQSAANRSGFPLRPSEGFIPALG
jgi:hypothetical protein